MKIAFDEHVPTVLVRVFETFATARGFKKIVGGTYEIKMASDYAPKPGEHDYARKNDVPWLKRFAAAGGKIVISGNTRMKYVPHERLALIELGFVVLFFENQWSDWKFFHKCALLLHWWPVISRTINRAKPGFWHIPANFKEKGKLRKISTEDPRKLKLERRAKERARRPRKRKVDVTPQLPPLPLFEHANAKAEKDPTQA